MVKDVSAPFLSLGASPGRADMMADLRQNYGIESVSMLEGVFSDFYAGVKKDGARVKEEMAAGEESGRGKIKPAASSVKAIAAARERRLASDFKKRAVTAG